MRRSALVVALVFAAACDPSAPREEPKAAQADADAGQATQAVSTRDETTSGPEPRAAVPVAASTGIDAALATQIVEGMNELCPDSWCEGAFDWHFARLECDAAKCTLHFAAQYEAREIPVAGEFEFALPSGAVEDGAESLAFWDALNPALGAWEDERRKLEEAKDPEGKGWEHPPTCSPLYLLMQVHAAAFFFEHGPVDAGRERLQIAKRFARDEPGPAKRHLDSLEAIAELSSKAPEAAKVRTEELRLALSEDRCLPEPVHQLFHGDLPPMP